MLRRLFGGGQQAAWPPPGPIMTWPRGSLDGELEVTAFLFDPRKNLVDVVGEGTYQDSLGRLAEGKTANGPRVPDHNAVLMPEPSNVYDANAVRVVVVTAGGHAATIGYLSRDDAVAYRPPIDRLAATGRVAACRAKVTGGWDRGGDDVGHFGVRLFLNPPSSLMADLDLE